MFFIFDILLSPHFNSLFVLNSLNSKNPLYVLSVALFITIFFKMPLSFLLLILFLAILDKLINNFYLKNMVNFIVAYLFLYTIDFKLMLGSLIYFMLFITLVNKT